MDFDHATLRELRRTHGAWNLLCATNAPLILCFLNAAFIKPGITVAPESYLVDKLRDLIFAIDERAPEGEKGQYPQDPLDYLMSWSSDECGYLSRAYLKADSDECYYDITPAAQKALDFIQSLFSYEFVGTESRLLQIIELLKQLNLGTESDKNAYIAELKAQRDALDEKIRRAEGGEMDKLSDVQIKDRFQQFEQQARALLSDFRQVEYNFRDLNREFRQKIELWGDSKGKLIDEVVGRSDVIDNTEQGRSALAFSRLLAQYRQTEMLSDYIDHVYTLPEVQALNYDPHVKKIYGEWLKADDRIHGTIGAINKRLRHFIDEKVYAENRSLIAAIKEVQENVSQIKSFDRALVDRFLTMEVPVCDLSLPMDRTLCELKEKLVLNSDLEEGEVGKDKLSGLYAQSAVRQEELYDHILNVLNTKEETTLAEVIERFPLKYGLEELLVYFEVCRQYFSEDVQESLDAVSWEGVNDENLPVIRKVLMERLVIRHKE